jgi:branched-chain amino acid transport system permease protein
MVVFVSLEPYQISAVVYASIFALMCIGLTLTYLTTKVPNFAHGSFVTIGIYTAFTLFRLRNVNPYVAAPVAFVAAGLVALMMYLGVLRPLTRRGSSLVSLMIGTLAVDIAFIGLFGIYTDYLFFNFRIPDAKSFVPINGDFGLFGIPGLFYIAPLSLALLTMGIHLLLTRTRFGVAMRAAVENANLARVMGIDVERVYVVSWFLAGGLAGLAGTYYTLWLSGGVDAGSEVIVAVFAGSILGGLSSIYGAVLGGIIIGGSEVSLTTLGAQLFGAGGVIAYQKGIPLIIMVLMLLILPGGITSLNRHRIRRVFRST